MSKKSILFFAAGAVAGWTAAQRFAGEAVPWVGSSSAPYGQDATPTDLWESRPESAPTRPDTTDRPVATGGDPFRGAFAGAMAELEAHAEEQDEPETHVA